MTLDPRPSDAELLARPHASGCLCDGCVSDRWDTACMAEWNDSQKGRVQPPPRRRPPRISEKATAHDSKCLCCSCYDAWVADTAAKREAIILVLPVPPSSNRWHRHVNGRAILSRAARQYTKLVKGMLDERRLTPLTGPVQVEIWWHRARKSGDLDKRLNILLDALQGAAYVADSQIEELHAYRLEGPQNPHVEVRVTPIPPPPTP